MGLGGGEREGLRVLSGRLTDAIASNNSISLNMNSFQYFLNRMVCGSESEIGEFVSMLQRCSSSSRQQMSGNFST